MIISNEHKYLFVELGRTGTTSVAMVLRKQCGGESILRKHSTLTKLLRILNKKDTNYFVFATVRNPLDKILSTYYKLQSYWTWEEIKTRSYLTRLYLTRRKIFLEKNDYNFEKFFLKFYKLPYVSVEQIEKHKYDYIMHFETLQTDFNNILNELNLDKSITLPKKNVTSNRINNNFYDYFQSPKMQKRAKWVFSLYFEDFNYKYPDSWGKLSNGLFKRLIKKVKLFIYNIYWSYFWGENKITNSKKVHLKKIIGSDF